MPKLDPAPPTTFAEVLQLDQPAAIRLIQTVPGLPPMARMGAASLLALLKPEDYARYRQLVKSGLLALLESERGRALLREVGLHGVIDNPPTDCNCGQ